MDKLVQLIVVFVINAILSGLTSGLLDYDEDFRFTRIEPGNVLGITTKVIAHIHRPAQRLTETWRLNREFTPPDVVTTLNAMCSEDLIENTIKWSNCELNNDGLSAELTYGVPERKNKTLQYLEMKYKTFEREGNLGKELCILSIVPENPVYFLLETFSKLPSNDTTVPRKTDEPVAAVHSHQLGKFGPQFLSIYGNSIDQDGIYNFDRDFTDRDEVYECLLSIGSSESSSVIEQKCHIKCEIITIGMHDEI